MPTIITESDAFPTTVQTPLATEPASAATLLSEFLQPIANRTRWVFNRLNVFVAGGSLTPSGNVSIQSPSTKNIIVNGITMSAVADGGEIVVAGDITTPSTMHANGMFSSGDVHADANLLVLGAGEIDGVLTVKNWIVSRKHIVSGSVTAGTSTYIPSGQTVYWDGVSSMAAGTAWGIQSATPQVGDWIKFVNDNPQAVLIKNNAGTTIDTLGGTGASPVKIADEYVWNGTAWARGSSPAYH